MIMNKIFKHTVATLLAGMALAACSPESFEGADPNGIPSMDGWISR